MDDLETFAYMLFTCSWSTDLGNCLPDYYYGDVIEAFSSCEDQACDIDGLWAFEWEKIMDRIAPVQLILGWDPREYLLEILRLNDISPLFDHGFFEESNNILFFKMKTNSVITDVISKFDVPLPHDKNRFNEVLEMTGQLAQKQQRGILFIGGWGWYYDMEIPKKIKPILRQAGLKIETRHA